MMDYDIYPDTQTPREREAERYRKMVHAPISDLREALDEIVIRALTAQQAFAYDRLQSSPTHLYLPEPKSEDVVAEILAVFEPALAAKERELIEAREWADEAINIRDDWVKSGKAQITEAVAAERERCAQKADQISGWCEGSNCRGNIEIAAAIRALPPSARKG